MEKWKMKRIRCSILLHYSHFFDNHHQISIWFWLNSFYLVVLSYDNQICSQFALILLEKFVISHERNNTIAAISSNSFALFSWWEKKFQLSTLNRVIYETSNVQQLPRFAMWMFLSNKLCCIYSNELMSIYHVVVFIYNILSLEAMTAYHHKLSGMECFLL